MTTDISECCFTCLNKNHDMACLDLNGTQMDKISTLFSIDFTSYRIYPKYLCLECNSNLNVTYNFHQRLNETLKLLEAYKTGTEILDSKVDTESFEEELTTTADSSLESDNNDNIDEIILIKTEHKQPDILSHDIINSALKDFKKTESSDCIKCDFKGSTRQALSRHIGLRHKDIARNWCKDCNNVFVDIKSHQNSHSKYLCNFCSKEVTRTHVKEHLMSHSGTYRCKRCDKLFKTSTLLKKHLSFHKRGSLQCEACEKLFDSKEKLNQHDCDSHIEGNACETAPDNKVALDCEAEFSCDNCQKKFKTKKKLGKHLVIHSNHFPYQCSFCNKRIRYHSRLIDHERIHTKEKPHVCNVCGKGFAQNSTLLTHIRQHTGKPESCDICGRRFCRKSELKLHLSKHAGIKQFLCPECGKAFFQMSHLTDHVNGHSQDRPYKCELCDKAFKKASVLKNHQKIHQDEKKFECSSCSYACITAYRLKQHEKTHFKSVGVVNDYQ